MENLVPIMIPAPCCQGNSSSTCPALEKILEEPRELIAEDLDALLREADKRRVRELQEEHEEVSQCSVVCLKPRVGSREWRKLMSIGWMVPGGSRREQRATQAMPHC